MGTTTTHVMVNADLGMFTFVIWTESWCVYIDTNVRRASFVGRHQHTPIRGGHFDIQNSDSGVKKWDRMIG